MQKKEGKTSKITLFAILVLAFTFLLTGCGKIDDMKVKMGLKNRDFEYIKQGKVQKIVIQSTRDKGFRFAVTDKKAINDLYDILSKAKSAGEKSSLAPDYIFEMYEGHDKVHKFNYIAGLDRKDSGNLYSDNKMYIVSRRLDSDIIKALWNIRTPKDFKEVYYGSMMNTLNQYLKDNTKNKSIGINLNNDVEAAKFILSIDLEQFKDDLSSKFKNVQLATKEKENYDVWVSVKTEGYKATLYKSVITFWDKAEKSEKKYYVLYKYENGSWNKQISTEKPKGF